MMRYKLKKSQMKCKLKKSQMKCKQKKNDENKLNNCVNYYFLKLQL